MRNFLLFLTITLFIFSSCNQNKIVFEESKRFENNSWNKFNSLDFTFSISDINSYYDFFLIIEHTSQLKIKILPISFYFYTPSGETRTMSYYIRIIDNNGNFNGEKKGDNWKLTIPLRKHFQFKENGTARIEIVNQLTKLETPEFIKVELIVKKQ
ncbi:MAG: gliding motility lipoprotein GldH [Bacteroidales bacterium]|nr:gliding motility lipoprotein GldH [Bacteroidales bacterium]